MKLLFKEDDQHEENNGNNNNNNNNTNDDEQQTVIEQQDQFIPQDEDFEQIYDIKLSEIPLTSFTCQELTRLYFFKEKNTINSNLLEKLSVSESQDLSLSDQIDLLVLIINLISTNNEIMSEYFEYLTRNLTEYSRERNQLLAEKRQLHEEEIKQKKLQLQNGDKEKLSSKKKSFFTPKNSLNKTNDENEQTIEQINADDDLKSVTQRRRQMVAISKELKEKKDLELQKLHHEQKIDLALEKIEQNYQDALWNFQNGFRIKPLGFDRYYNRYWFFKGHPALFIEKGWIGSDITYCTQIASSSSSPTKLNSYVNGEKFLPKNEENQWWIYDDEKLIEQFLQSLNERGIREQNLLGNLKKIQPILKSEFQKNSSQTENMDTDSQQTNDIILSFQTDLEDLENRLRLGSLGGFIIPENLTDWQTKLKQTNERLNLAELLIQLQQTVPDKFASGIFGTHIQTRKSSSKKKKFSSNLSIWMNDCRTCKTFSRLYVLMLIFENSIAWNKSTQGLKCKVCRKKNKEEYILVCDQCCQGYHLDCLRDDSANSNQTKNSINDLWYCPACRPQSLSKRRYEKKSKTDYYDTDIYDMDIDMTSNVSSHLSDLHSEQSHGNEHEPDYSCSICSSETTDNNELIQCTQCRQYYHCQCHEPPLRCPPRSTTWVCNNCRNGLHLTSKRTETTTITTGRKHSNQTQRQNGMRRTVRKNYREIEEDDDDNESDYEQELHNQRRSSKRIRRNKSPQSINDDDDDQQSEEEIYHVRPTRRRVRIAKSSSSSSSSSQLSDEDEILADIHDDDDDDDAGEEEEEMDDDEQEESDIEQDDNDVDEEQEENGIIDGPSLQ